MSKTNTGLVAHCEKALKEKWYYLWGAYGQIATADIINKNIAQYPSNAQWRIYASGAIGKTRVCDCYGLVKSYLWWADDNNNPKYNAKHDMNTQMAYDRAKEKGALSTLPEVPGIILWMKGHVGVYIGNGRFIECAGGGQGMIEGKIQGVQGGRIVKGSKFTHWFKDINIEYAAEKPKNEIDIMINDKKYSIEAINKDGYNYIKLQGLRQAGVEVSFDAKLNMPVLKW